jgi:hypothetical protein
LLALGWFPAWMAPLVASSAENVMTILQGAAG